MNLSHVLVSNGLNATFLVDDFVKATAAAQEEGDKNETASAAATAQEEAEKNAKATK